MSHNAKFLVYSISSHESARMSNDFFHNSLVENQNDLELDFKVFLLADSCCSDIVLDESN